MVTESPEYLLLTQSNRIPDASRYDEVFYQRINAVSKLNSSPVPEDILTPDSGDLVYDLRVRA